MTRATSSPARFTALIATTLICPASFAQAPQFQVPGETPQTTAPLPVFAPPQQFAAQVQQSPPRKGRMRQFFAQTLSLVAQGSGANAAVGIGDLVAGSINDWFARKARKNGDLEANNGFVAPAANAPVFQQPVFQQQGAVPPVFADHQAAAVTAPQFAPVQFFDTQTGASTTPLPAFDFYAAAATTAPPANEVFAGMAFEVHALLNGTAVPVNPANHEFRSGDQFVVMYRPSLPGHVRVTNINPLGVATDIDSREAAAGELLRLGPYRFEGTRGDESLRFVLQPCSNDALLVATRDIVRADSAPTGTLNLGSCHPTRSIDRPATRDIRKVAVEGNTGFAFDPVSSSELASGQLAPRELTVRFRHR